MARTVEEVKHTDAMMREARLAERERCARLIELIAADWREAGADQKVWASEYLARQIRDLGLAESASRPCDN